MRKEVRIVEVDGVRMIVVDNEAFDWGVDENDWSAARIRCKNDPEMRIFFLGGIQGFLVRCFSEFIGKQVTLAEINKALSEGYIEV